VASFLMMMFIVIYQLVDDADTVICLRVDEVSYMLVIASVLTALGQILLICYTVKVMRLIHGKNPLLFFSNYQ